MAEVSSFDNQESYENDNRTVRNCFFYKGIDLRFILCHKHRGQTCNQLYVAR